MQIKKLIINGQEQSILSKADRSLASVLREQLLLTGCKVGCNAGHCGACAILMDGKVTRSCITKMDRVPEGAEIETIEGIGTSSKLHPLQLAWMAHGCAQCGFCSPGFIMSAKGLLAENDNPTREEVRDWFQKNQNLCRCTGYKPLVDAVMDAAKVIRGEMDKDELIFKPTDNVILGSNFVRPSAQAKVMGTWDFGADAALRLPEGALHLGLARAKVPHANILSIDTSEAEKMPGVFKVITHKDVPGKNRITGLITFPSNKGDGWDRPILNDTKIFQYGDVYAIVAADTEENARAAADKVHIELEELPAYLSAPDAIADDAMEIHPGVPNAYFETLNNKGNSTKEEVQKLIDEAPHSVEVESYCSRQPHLFLEPDNGFAYIDDEGRVTVHSKSIAIHIHQAMIAAGIGIEAEKLRIVQNNAGGTFGYKLSPTVEAWLGLAALICERPVILQYTMPESILYTGKRSPAYMHVRMAADEEGNLLALEGDNIMDHGPYSEFGDLLTTRLTQFVGAGYKLPKIYNYSRQVATNHAWGSAFRSYGSPQAYMGSEIAMDMLAEEVGMDPFEFRYKNVYREGDTTPTRQEPDALCLEEMFDKMRPTYEEAKKRCKELSTDKEKYGVGVAVGVYGCGLDGADSSEATVELTAEGVKVISSWEDHGQGADSGALTSAHETLRQAGFTPEDIILEMNDTALPPNSGPACGSRSTPITGNAIRVASEMLINAMKKEDGSFRTYQEMVDEKIPTSYDGKWVASMCTDMDVMTGEGKPFSVYMYTLFMPEVKVDMESGKVEVTKFHCMTDVGTIMNKLVVDGQVYGGLAQGIGLALSEDFEDVTQHNSLIRCGIPRIKDVTDELNISYLETYRDAGTYGAAGVGEATLSAPHPAILNAIHDATGARIMEVPATPEVVKDALAKL